MNNPYMNPQMFDQYKDHFTGEKAAAATEQIKNMSDEQLEYISKMSGMNIDPKLARMASEQFSKMNDTERERIATLARSMSQPAAQPSTNTQAQAKPQIASTQFPEITRLKESGNEAFKNKKFEEAGTAYFNAILEIEELQAKPSYASMEATRKSELRTLELLVRGNYANVKAKEGDYQLVKEHAQKILAIDPDNFKGAFRLGQALHHYKKYEAALPHLKKAKTLQPNDQQVQELYASVCKHLEETKTVQSQSQSQNKEPEKNLNEKKEKPSVPNQNARKKEEENDFGMSEEEMLNLKQLKQKRKQEEEKLLVGAQISKSTEPQSVVIEEEKEPAVQPAVNNSNGSHRAQAMPGAFPKNIDPGMLEKSREEMSKMSPDQLQQQVNMMKSMDRTFLKNMYKQQFNMDIDENQLNMMLNMMTPEMVQQASKMNLGAGGAMPQMPVSGSSEVSSTGTTNTTTNTTTAASAAPAMPSFNSAQMQDLLGNKDMMQNVMNQLKSNPEMLRSMGSMLGENHPMSSYLNKASPEDLQKLISTFQRFQPVIQFGIRAFGLVKRYRYAIAVVLSALVAYYFFGGRSRQDEGDDI